MEIPRVGEAGARAAAEMPCQSEVPHGHPDQSGPVRPRPRARSGDRRRGRRDRAHAARPRGVAGATASRGCFACCCRARRATTRRSRRSIVAAIEELAPHDASIAWNVFVANSSGGLDQPFAFGLKGEVAAVARATPPSASIISTVRPASPGSRSATTTLAPARGSKIAAARPLPIPSPAAPPTLTIATLPAKPEPPRSFMRATTGVEFGGRRLELNLFSYIQGVIHLNPEVSDGAFQFGYDRGEAGPHASFRSCDRSGQPSCDASRACRSTLNSKPMLLTQQCTSRAYWRIEM